LATFFVLGVGAWIISFSVSHENVGISGGSVSVGMAIVEGGDNWELSKASSSGFPGFRQGMTHPATPCKRAFCKESFRVRQPKKGQQWQSAQLVNLTSSRPRGSLQ
jgi:hypothetical protein